MKRCSSSSPGSSGGGDEGGDEGGSGDEGGISDLQARNVSPRTALLSWKPPSNPVGSYRLTYQREGQEGKVRRALMKILEYLRTLLSYSTDFPVTGNSDVTGLIPL